MQTAADADAYLARLHAFATALDQDLERLARSTRPPGVVAPDFVLDTTLAQLQALRGQPAAETVLVQSLARRPGQAGLAGDYGATRRRIVAERGVPGARPPDRSPVQGAARPGRRTTPASGGCRDGDAYYAAASGGGDHHHPGARGGAPGSGLDQVTEITGRMDAILKRAGHDQGHGRPSG